ncbi:DEAD/DEAH box helicase family protein [Patescibacteria group bacterium]|nr:DEAD/DEAH box helicase family protein [Patescibacteria group bacterium]
MKHLEHPQHLSEEFKKRFPHKKMRPDQRAALEFIAYHKKSLHEMPTGRGKTATGVTPLKAFKEIGVKPIIYATTTKTLVRQAKKMYPEGVVEAYGRNEYPCLFYKDKREKVTAEESPCSLLKCPHRVDLDTGKTVEPGVEPCPYLLVKHRAMKGDIIVCTIAYLVTHMLYVKKFKASPPKVLVIDEVHRLAEVTRQILSWDISGLTLKRAIKALSVIRREWLLERFLEEMMKIAKLKPTEPPELLADHEIKRLISLLEEINTKELRGTINKALELGILDPKKDRKTLKTLEIVVRHIPWYIKELFYATGTETRKPSNYVFMFYRKKRRKRGKRGPRVICKLCIRHFYVSPVIRLKILEPIERIIAYSATIGDKETFAIETGIDFPFQVYTSTFPIENTRVFLPTDTPNLAVKANPGRGALARAKNRAFSIIAKGCREFLKKEFRSLITVVSEAERLKFLERHSKDFKIMTYGPGLKAKDAARRFIEGEGDVLLGTVAQFGEGIDLPREIAPVIWVLRPPYPRPMDPASQFEERRWGVLRWRLIKYRVTVKALQVRGRNIRTAEDIGMCFFISKQFNRVLGGLPEWLEGARFEAPFDECLEEGLRLLTKES